MKRLSLMIERFYRGGDLSRAAAVGYLTAFTLAILYALYTNRPCLFFDWDGRTQSVTMDYFEQFATPFSIAMIDPLQAMFDVFYLGYRGAVPPLLVMRALGMPGMNELLTHAFYDA